MTRIVVLLCGPPGAGKSTAARASGLSVFDRDDARWRTDAEFAAALDRVGADTAARAVVIRAGATSTARARAARTVAATSTFVMLAPRDVLIDRVRRRGRGDRVRTIAGVDRWLARFDRDDGVRDFPGWAAALAPDLGVSSPW